MLNPISTDRFALSRPLFRGHLAHDPIVQGVLSGDHPGWVLVDREPEPRTALLWAFSDRLFCVGAADTLTPHALAELFHERLVPKAREIGQPFFQVQGEPVDAWSEHLNQVSPHTTVSFRQAFRFDRDLFERLPAKPELEGARLVPIDAELLAEQADLRERVLASWPSEEAFLTRGFGFCYRVGVELPSVCLASHVGGGAVELSINTDLEVRNRGMATRLCRRFIAESLQRGLLPCWGTETFRLPSIVLAQKLGFIPTFTFPTYCFATGTNQPDDQFLGELYYRESRVAGSETDEPQAVRVARGWSLASDTERAASFAARALAEGWAGHSTLATDPDFARLRASAAWPRLNVPLKSHMG